MYNVLYLFYIKNNLSGSTMIQKAYENSKCTAFHSYAKNNLIKTFIPRNFMHKP